MDLVYLGILVNTHGIKGEVRISSDFELCDKAFKIGNKLTINRVDYEITSYRIHKNFHMVTFAGINNINQIEFLKGSEVYIRRNYLELKDNEFLLNDLIGLNVYFNNELIGICSDFKKGINPLIEINNNKYIPYNDEFIKNINISENRIELNDIAKELI